MTDFRHHKICIFGCGNHGKRLYNHLYSTDTDVCCIFCDNDESKHTDTKYKVISPKTAAERIKLHELDCIYIPGASSLSLKLAMINQLLQFKVDADTIYVADIDKATAGLHKIRLTKLAELDLVDMYAQLEGRINQLTNQRDKLDRLHESVVESAWNDDNSLKQYVCMRPFTKMVVTRNEVYICCEPYIKNGYSIGRISDELHDVWNSDKIKKLRYSVLHGSYEYCYKICPYLHNPEQYPAVMIPRSRAATTAALSEAAEANKWQDCMLNVGPAYIDICIDDTCNLRCASCRSDIRAGSGEHNMQVSSILEQFVRPMLRGCTNLSTVGDGEFFASKPTMEFYQTLSLKEYPGLRLSIITNGTLFTPARWGTLSNLKGMVSTVMVSIDAATKHTYEKLRRGGKWEALCKNMEFIASLRDTSEITKLVINFVVQKENYRELADLIKLAMSWNVDEIYLIYLENRGTFSAERYIEQNVLHPKNPLSKEVRSMIQELASKTNIRITGNCFVEPG